MTGPANVVTSAATTPLVGLGRAKDTLAMDDQTVLAALTQEVLVAAAALGKDSEAIASAAGLQPEVLADPDGRVPLVAHFRMWELLSREPIGLELGARLGLSGMGVIGYAMQHDATVGSALAFQRRYRAVIHPDVVPAFELRDAGRLVFTRPISPPFIRLREPVEAQASAIVSMMRLLSGQPLRPLFVALPLPRPPDPSRQEAFFACPVAWSAPTLDVALDAALLDTPLSRSDERLFGYLSRRAQELHSSLPAESTWATRVQREIGALLPHGEPRLADVAKRLGVSERTLHRRLEVDATKFATLLDGARRERALVLVDDPGLGVSGLAFLLGYSEPAAFFRAFKRWTGETPKSYRAAAQPGAAR